MTHTGKLAPVLILVLLLVAIRGVTQDDPTIVCLPALTVQPGSSFQVDIKVKNYRDIISTSFSLNWDPTMLRFLRLKDYVYDVSNPEDIFGILRDTGIVAFSWFDNNLEPMTLDDSTTIMCLEFKAIGPQGGYSALTFGDHPAIREIVDTSEVAIPMQFINGRIDIDRRSAWQDDLLLLEDAAVTPHPIAATGSTLHFFLPEKSLTTLRLYTLDGKLVLEEQHVLSTGSHSIPLARSIFVQSGLYVLQVQTEKYFFQKKLVVP